jgi:hypothetical protein
LQAHSLLYEAFPSQRRVAGFDADRGSSANAVEQLVAVEHRLHPEFRLTVIVRTRPISASKV